MARNGKKAAPTTINGETGEIEPIPGEKKRVRTKLDTTEDILKEMRRLYRRAKEQNSEPSKLIWMLGEIRKAMETDVIANQVEQLKSMYLRYGAPDLLAAPDDQPEAPATMQ